MQYEALPNFSNLGPYGVESGASPARSFTIFAHLLSDRLDEFLIQNLYAAAACRSFNHARLFVFYHNRPPFHRDITKMNTNITYSWQADGTASIPLDYFDSSKDAALRSGSPVWYEQSCDKPDLMLLPSIMDWRHLGAFERPPRFVLPRGQVPTINRAFRSLGVDPNWWYCAATVPDHDAIVNLDEFSATLRVVADVIVKEHGACLVLVGDPATKLGPLPDGVIDARSLPRGIFGQAYAIAKARFLFDFFPSPWLWLAFGLDTPWLRRTDTHAAIPLPGRGFIFAAPSASNDGPRTASAVTAMIRETEDCPMWRSDPRDNFGPAKNRMDLPMPWGPNARMINID